MIRVPLQVRYSDHDERGHVNNAVYLTYFEVARAAAWRAAMGTDEAAPPAFVDAQATVSYRSPARLGDPLAVEVSAGEIRSKAWTWTYRVVDERDGRLVADGETTQVAYDYVAGKTIEIPAELRAGLGRV